MVKDSTMRSRARTNGTDSLLAQVCHVRKGLPAHAFVHCPLLSFHTGRINKHQKWWCPNKHNTFNPTIDHQSRPRLDAEATLQKLTMSGCRVTLSDRSSCSRCKALTLWEALRAKSRIPVKSMSRRLPSTFAEQKRRRGSGYWNSNKTRDLRFQWLSFRSPAYKRLFGASETMKTLGVTTAGRFGLIQSTE